MSATCMQCDGPLAARLDCPDRHLRFCVATRYAEGRMPIPVPVSANRVAPHLPSPRSLGYLPPPPGRLPPADNPPYAEWHAENVHLLNDPCSYCGEPATAIDHITPRWLGGTNTTDNATAVCRRCNSSKGKWPLLIWLARRTA